jgi:hypothetical protein
LLGFELGFVGSFDDGGDEGWRDSTESSDWIAQGQQEDKLVSLAK